MSMDWNLSALKLGGCTYAGGAKHSLALCGGLKDGTGASLPKRQKTFWMVEAAHQSDFV